MSLHLKQARGKIMNNFLEHSEIHTIAQDIASRYHAQTGHVVKMFADECQYELERFKLPNRYNDRLRIINDMRGRVRSWLEEMNNPTELITSGQLAACRLPYLYFTRLYKK